MKILHICLDHNFIENSKIIFERFYASQNIFIVNTKYSKFNRIRDADGFVKFDLTKKKDVLEVEKICRESKVNIIVLHGIFKELYPMVAHLKKILNCEIYWIFWGYELYQLLGYEKGYQLIDSPMSLLRKETYLLPNKISKIIRKLTNKYLPDTVKHVLPYVDFFCFWNKSDYNLLIKNYKYPIRYKYFAYCANIRGKQPSSLFPLEERKAKTILINHQASFYGNHDTIFKKIKEIDKDNYYIKIVPLSYGNGVMRERILKLGNKLFGSKFQPIMEYLPACDYFNLLRDVDVAIFGQRRQEASGNIIQMLKNGVKVFLRNDNNLLDFYREKGYIIFSFENDLKNINSLNSLTMEQKDYNRNCYLNNMVYYEDYMPYLFTN